MSSSVPSDIEIARKAKMVPILGLLKDRFGVEAHDLEPFGHYKAKLSFEYCASLQARDDGKLILVTAITPTPLGEGKTTVTVGLGDALNRIGKQTIMALREPSLGPCFGMKGGAAGGGYAQVVPMEDINLHFTGDFHAMTSANNLLAAMIDNHIYWGNELEIDGRRIEWRRVEDMNDRSLREITIGLGGTKNGFPRTDHFDITVASEIMAIVCLSNDLDELQARLGRIVIGYTRKQKPITARDLKADGAMCVLLKQALQPNVVQTLENNIAFVHGGPFANIAHGCNSIIATKTALKMADYVVTEAGFGADLGAEKFFHIKCRQAGIKPDCAVVVATVRALKSHDGEGCLEKGFSNLERHIRNVQKFKVNIVVALNRFVDDTAEELDQVVQFCESLGVKAVVADHWAKGSAGAENLAHTVVQTIDGNKSDFGWLYEESDSLWNKARTLATELYGAKEIIADQAIRKKFADFEEAGYGKFAICIAKTPLSFSSDPKLKGAPSGHVLPIRDIRLAAGAGFMVVYCGDIFTMPGLPRHPAAEAIHLNEAGEVEGLF